MIPAVAVADDLAAAATPPRLDLSRAVYMARQRRASPPPPDDSGSPVIFHDLHDRVSILNLTPTPSVFERPPPDSPGARTVFIVKKDIKNHFFGQK